MKELAKRRLFTIRPVQSVVILGMALLLAPAVGAEEEQTYDLRPHWQPGQSSRYEFWTLQDQKQTMAFGGNSRDFTTQMEFTGEMTWTVEKVKSDGSSTCTLTLEWITATVSSTNQKKMVNDTRKASGDIQTMHDLLKAMTGVPLTVQVKPDGAISKVTGMKKMQSRTTTPDAILSELEFMETASDLATLVGPPPQLKVGHGWKSDFRWKHRMGHMSQAYVFTLDSVEQVEGIALATINGKAKLKFEFDRSNIPANAPPIKLKLRSGEASTQVLFDLQRHEAVGRNSVQDELIEMTSQTPQGPMKATFNLHAQSQVLRIRED